MEVISARIFHWNSEQVLHLSPMARKREKIGRDGEKQKEVLPTQEGFLESQLG